MNKSKEFDIMGHKVRLKTEYKESEIAEKVIDHFNKEIININSMNSGLEPNKKILLAALKITGDYVDLKNKCKEQMTSFEDSINDALNLMEQFNFVDPNNSTIN